jgi:regulator of sirC expression with transglutaminase-like and TPR domain
VTRESENGSVRVHRASARAELAAIVERLDADEDADVDLAHAALWIAAEHDAVDVSGSLRQLDALAQSVGQRLAGVRGQSARVHALVEVLARAESFGCDFEQFDEPSQSFLNRVLERRSGLPILLALVYLDVARRLGLTLHGLGTPGRFLLRAPGEDDLILDPAEGRILNDAQCTRLFRELLGRPDVVFSREELRPASAREILVRILVNLRNAYVRRSSWSDALLCSERILLLAPDAPEELWQRSLLYEQLECYPAALADLTRFLELYPDHGEVAAVRSRAEQLRERCPVVH